jgi:hypothetical protein
MHVVLALLARLFAVVFVLRAFSTAASRGLCRAILLCFDLEDEEANSMVCKELKGNGSN